MLSNYNQIYYRYIVFFYIRIYVDHDSAYCPFGVNFSFTMNVLYDLYTLDPISLKV